MLIEQLKAQQVLPVLVIETIEQAAPLAELLLKYQLNCIEITLRTRSALQVLNYLARQYPELIIGAGTVLNVEQFDQVQQAGASFAISPGATEPLLAKAARSEMTFIPGVMTASETMQAQGYGFKLQKLFPAQVAGGVELLKAFSGPFSELLFCPTGGVNPNNMADYLALNNVAVVGGTWLAPLAQIQAGNWQQIESNFASLQGQLTVSV
ncbi:2-dehydro-3-deoxyphosphogluconate aldolase / (4S)-4-hydroxy-2-oxoglutarate aldolase [Oceanospirillum multiglobuliferum]|uniref:Keto-deoxy-phosphogluconate aldolase n=1 Tax=Oceanospirillum multiglobuliferum TaxID=64969 RepID=A0A1T4MIC6_9GAMM|nr:bifunctional 4-hydroxy-2-oxoglutarate aldolase/2-dehydro-3-deoxy-phosphogluconate aldolase [Oceanospirillum multiglobuliferum]OPX57014.1 hypothetical protein BTE48_00845 [Oceanospirillum multiglobuliferum]SJZ66712.1 2-dehydro-3-deoxyphosphogluconate aldolase / (4S)-4-hydroxy-2-oxoglutarate aldolase [Oceanospirillum multiglobuliferum]